MSERGETGCVCHGPGFCERHKVEKNQTWYLLCKTAPAYFRLWEEGRGPGQAVPTSAARENPTPPLTLRA